MAIPLIGAALKLVQNAAKGRGTRAALANPRKAGRDVLAGALKAKGFEGTPAEFANATTKLNKGTQTKINAALSAGDTSKAMEVFSNEISRQLGDVKRTVNRLTNRNINFTRRDPNEVNRVARNIMKNDVSLEEAIVASARDRGFITQGVTGLTAVTQRPATQELDNALKIARNRRIRDEQLKMGDKELVAKAYSDALSNEERDPTVGITKTKGDVKLTVNTAYGQVDVDYSADRLRRDQRQVRNPTSSPISANIGFIKAMSRGMTRNGDYLRGQPVKQDFMNLILRTAAALSPSRQTALSEHTFTHTFTIYDSQGIASSAVTADMFYKEVAEYLGIPRSQFPDDMLNPPALGG